MRSDNRGRPPPVPAAWPDPAAARAGFTIAGVLQAIQAGDAAYVEGALHAGLPPNADDDDGVSLLAMAARAGHRGVVDRLLRAQADVRQQSRSGLSPLHCAAQAASRDVCEALTSAVTPAAVKELVNLSNHQGDRPLMFACVVSSPAVVRWLLAHGAQPAATNRHGLTALHCAVASRCDAPAAEARQCEVVAALLASAPELIAVADERGQTPLHTAASSSSRAVVEVLLARKADLSAKNNSGKVPLDLATADTAPPLQEAWQALLAAQQRALRDLLAGEDEGRARGKPRKGKGKAAAAPTTDGAASQPRPALQPPLSGTGGLVEGPLTPTAPPPVSRQRVQAAAPEPGPLADTAARDAATPAPAGRLPADDPIVAKASLTPGEEQEADRAANALQQTHGGGGPPDQLGKPPSGPSASRPLQPRPSQPAPSDGDATQRRGGLQEPSATPTPTGEWQQVEPRSVASRKRRSDVPPEPGMGAPTSATTQHRAREGRAGRTPDPPTPPDPPTSAAGAPAGPPGAGPPPSSGDSPGPGSSPAPTGPGRPLPAPLSAGGRRPSPQSVPEEADKGVRTEAAPGADPLPALQAALDELHPRAGVMGLLPRHLLGVDWALLSMGQLEIVEDILLSLQRRLGQAMVDQARRLEQQHHEAQSDIQRQRAALLAGRGGGGR